MTLDYDEYKEGGILNNRYQKIEDISEGSYGYVSLAKDLKEKKLVAVKYIFKLDQEDDEDRRCDDDVDIGRDDESIASSVEKREQMLKHKKSMISSKVRSRLSNDVCLEAIYEVDIQTKVGFHKNIAALLDYFDSYIIMEYCSGGDLYEAIKDDIVPRKTKEVSHILTQIMDAIEYCHSKNIYHRDIKPENILISGVDWTIKLTDWGLATTSETSLDRNVGSERYMAPELFESNLDLQERKKPYECAKVDLWSMGIVFLNIVFQKNPFSVADQSDKSFCYFAANREALFDVFSTMSYDFFQVLRYSLTIDPTNRDMKKMRFELENLSEYTLDDEYYNSQQEEGYESQSSLDTQLLPPPSSAPVPFSLPTPGPSNVAIIGPESKPVQKEHKIEDIVPAHHLDPSLDVNEMHQRAKSVPKFKFQKRSHPKNETILNNYHRNTRKYSNESKNKYGNGIKIQRKKKNTIIKNSRMPLGIPTPNTHINNFFNDYKSKESFNTREFFTPPSVHQRYIDGIFNNKHYKQQHRYNNNSNNNNTNNNHHHNNSYNYNNNNNNFSKSWNNKNSNSSYNNYTNYNNNYTKNRRPSTTGATGYGDNLTIPNFKGHPKNNSGPRARGTSPNRYVSPNSRSNIQFHSSSPNIPNISSVLDEPPATYHEQYAQDSTSAYSGTTDNDLDDVLFTLEENDYDFVQDMNKMSLNDSSRVYTPTAQKQDVRNVPAIDVSSSSDHRDQLPDLLKSPSPETEQLSNFASHKPNSFNNMSPLLQPTKQQHAPRRGSEHKYKPGVYIPPHQRRNSANETTLSVSHNSVNYGSSVNARRSSMNSSLSSVAGRSPPNNVTGRSPPGFPQPFVSRNHAFSTTAIQSKDVFADTDNNALIFEDDDEEDEGGKYPHEKSMFGPYEIYDQSTEKTNNSGRKSSTLQDQAVGSLEQYKNNWLMLQQQQD